MTGLTIQPEIHGGLGVLTLVGEIRVELVSELQRAAAAAVAAGAHSLILELSELRFVDSASMGALLQLGKQRKAAGGRLILCAPRSSVLRVLDACGLAGHFEVAPHLPEARTLLASGAAPGPGGAGGAGGKASSGVLPRPSPRPPPKR